MKKSDAEKAAIRRILEGLRQAPRGRGGIHTFQCSDEELSVFLKAINFYSRMIAKKLHHQHAEDVGRDVKKAYDEVKAKKARK